MTVTEALQLIEKNKHIPALKYCIYYAKATLIMVKRADISKYGFKLQLANVLNNMTHWKQDFLTSPTTAEEIKECRAVLKKTSV